LVGIIIILVVGEFSTTLAYMCMSLRLRTFSDLAQLQHLSITVNALAAGGDMLIAVTLCTILHKSRTGFHGSNTMINKLITYVVSTGVATSLCAVASTISTLVAGETFIYIAFYFCIGRLYSNSLLATLNARDSIRSAANVSQNDDFFAPQISKTTMFFGESVTDSSSGQGLEDAKVDPAST